MKRLNVFGKLLPYLLFTSLLFSSCVDANNEAVIADETVGVKSVEPEFTTGR